MQLVDAYRSIHSEEGFTWNRGKIYSRLDYIFVTESVARNIVSAELDWAFDKSDHAAVIVSLKTNNDLVSGPGPTKVNTKVLEDLTRANQIGIEIHELMKQVKEHWNPHQRLEFMKVAIRSAFANSTGEKRKNLRSDIKELEEEVNEFEGVKLKEISKSNETKDSVMNIELIEVAIRDLRSKLESLNKKLSETREFISRTKWFEYGEKPNKFFLNLNKARQKKNLIGSIKNEDIVYEGQNRVVEGISKFYSELYAARPSKDRENEEDFYKHCPKLTVEQR